MPKVDKVKNGWFCMLVLIGKDGISLFLQYPENFDAKSPHSISMKMAPLGLYAEPRNQSMHFMLRPPRSRWMLSSGKHRILSRTRSPPFMILQIPAGPAQSAVKQSGSFKSAGNGQ